jgi:predicted TIM-barrel fold metal-dependent hydrolase
MEDINVKIIAIEEHWNSVGIRDALDRLQGGARDESVAFNTMGDNQARLEDIGQGRVEAMDAAGIDVSILSVVTPATQALPARQAVALAREANDEATDAVRAHPAASARSRPCRPAIRRLRPPNSNGAPPGWVTSAR